VKILSDNHVLTDTDTVITVGTFDGIHLGHKSIIQKLTETARKRNCKSVVFTFNNHPRNVLQSDKWLKLITTIQERNTLLSQMGVDYIYIQDFTKSFSQLTGSAFIQSMLIEKLNLKHLIVGYDHHFGRDRLGDINTIKNIGLVSGFDVSKVEPLEIGNIKVSSSKIRKALESGDIHIANQLLGYDFFITGTIIQGNKLGREIGYPTANVKITDSLKLVPATGVYAVEAIVKNQNYIGMMNIGFRPTVTENSSASSIEIHLIDFEGDIYESDITVMFKLKIRNEKKFESITDLQAQLAKDKEYVKRLLYYSRY